MSEYVINGIPIKFPFEPYDLQKDYMSKVIDCLQNDQNGVLESPTGTGKTVSLLCSSLAWLEVKKAQMQAESLEKRMTGDEHDDRMNSLLGQLKAAGGAGFKNRSAFVQWPQIIYASRTHSQLSQAMNELKRTAYRYMKASVLGSREQMCVHPEIKELENNALKVQMCRLKVQTRSCSYHNKVERQKDNPALTTNPVIDIEDLVKLGEAHKFCPYYMSKELKQHADIVFMPYNYLLDPRARKALGVELANSVIILDEAHNVEKICEDSASMQIKSTDITLCIEEATEVMKVIGDDNQQMAFRDTPPDFSPEEVMMLKGMFLNFEKALDSVPLPNPIEGFTFDGSYIFKLFEDSGITDQNNQMVMGLIEKICTFLVTANEGPFQRKGHGMQLFEDLMRIAYASTAPDFKEKLQKCYKVHILVENESKKFGNQRPQRGNWLTKANAVKTKSACRVLSYWCFSPGFGMNMLMGQGIKCVILTSGTLAPLKPLITELELKVDVRLENPHIVKGDQVCVKILSKGPDGTLLNSNYQNRSNPAYIKSLGMTICNLTRIIPDGLLIFFPSYPIMKQCQDSWQEEGLWANICSIKRIYVEPREKVAFAEAMRNYYESVNDPESQGAIFMGVCRGKVSEGLDFIDANGRAVIITGLPYPPMKDPRIILKKRYLDLCRTRNKEYLSGDEWYSLEATKAVNQAIGRVIRHGKDYGAIILLDTRFNNSRIINQMSLWLRSHVKHANNYGEIVRELRGFFKDAQAKFPVTNRRNPLEKIDITKSASFNSTQGYRNEGAGSSNEVKINKRAGPALEPEIKRTKIILVKRDYRDKDENAKEDDEANLEPSINDIKEYLSMVQKKLGSEDVYNKFITALKLYLKDADLAKLLGCVANILNDHPTVSHLMIGLRNFMRPEHKEEFDSLLTDFGL